jgi:nucleoside-diphosphate-sugar epimerase
MTNSVLVTGGAGSMGKLAVMRLLELGYSVRVFDLPGLDYSELEELSGVTVFEGDITQPDSIGPAVEGIAAAIHLAALLPPVSEKDRDFTFAVNVDGSQAVAEAIAERNKGAALILSSSVSTYGDTTGDSSVITINYKQSPLDIYGASKITAETVCRNIYPDTTILRISGVSVPAFSEPPEVWPFTEDQRIEFIHRDDAVSAICSAVASTRARGQTYNISGGESWRMTGKQYVKDYFDLLGVPMEEAQFQSQPGWCDWYDTMVSQEHLAYQNTSYTTYLGQIEKEVQALMAGFDE